MYNLLEATLQFQKTCMGLFRPHTKEEWEPVAINNNAGIVQTVFIDEFLTLSIKPYPLYTGVYIRFPKGRNLYEMLQSSEEWQEFQKQLKDK